MKKIVNKKLNSSNLAFIFLLAFLACIPLSIAACYIFFSAMLMIYFYQLVRGERWPKMPRFFYFFLIFAGFTVISCFFAINFNTSIKDSKELLIFLLFPLFFTILNSEERVRLSLYVVLISQIISSFIGLFQSYVIGVTLDNRIKGLTSHWMTFSGLLMIIIIYFFIIGYYRNKWSQKILCWLPLLPALAALAASLTRAMWVGLAAAIITFFVAVKPKVLLVTIPIIVGVILLSPPPVKQRIASILDMQNDTNRDRIYMTYAAWKIFIDKPFTGVGPDNILEVYPTYKHPDAKNINMHLHNNFLQLLAERGVFALLSFLLAFFVLMRDLWLRQKKLQEPFNIRSRAVFFMLIGFLISGLFEYNFGHSQVKFLLFFFMAIPFLEIHESVNSEL